MWGRSLLNASEVLSWPSNMNDTGEVATLTIPADPAMDKADPSKSKVAVAFCSIVE